jgi:hypothetical protein
MTSYTAIRLPQDLTCKVGIRRKTSLEIVIHCQYTEREFYKKCTLRIIIKKIAEDLNLWPVDHMRSHLKSYGTRLSKSKVKNPGMYRLLPNRGKRKLDLDKHKCHIWQKFFSTKKKTFKPMSNTQIDQPDCISNGHLQYKAKKSISSSQIDTLKNTGPSINTEQLD